MSNLEDKYWPVEARREKQNEPMPTSRRLSPIAFNYLLLYLTMHLQERVTRRLNQTLPEIFSGVFRGESHHIARCQILIRTVCVCIHRRETNPEELLVTRRKENE